MTTNEARGGTDMTTNEHHKLEIAIEALRMIKESRAPDEIRNKDSWHSGYARQLAEDTLSRIGASGIIIEDGEVA